MTGKGGNMPVITMDGPPVMNAVKKREMATAITRIAADYYGLSPETIVILIKESGPENVSVGGKLISDRNMA